MNEEKWLDTIAHIKDNFEDVQITKGDLPDEDGPGEIEVVEFSGPLGKMKLEFTTKPLVLDKRTIGSRRIGSDVKVEYKYSDTDNVNKLKIYKYNDATDSWDEMEPERSASMFF